MKTIKIKILNYNEKDTCSYGFYFVSVLKKHYTIEFSENPDYLFFNESNLDHIKYDCIKIFYTGENIHPNFNFCDYATGFDHISFLDRYYRLPIYLVETLYREKELAQKKNTDPFSETPFTSEDLKKKTDFCSFVYSNYLADENRRSIFTLLNSYKKVNSAGKYLNNTGFLTDNKVEFEKKHKFSIAFENSSNDGYTTEKILNSISAKTIPLYWGNPNIASEFNEERFINCHKFKNFEEVLEEVKKIDRDDSLYLHKVNQPLLLEREQSSKIKKDFESFLKNIFDQPIENAKRVRINDARHADLVKNEKITHIIILIKNKVREFLAFLYKPFKKIKRIDSIKQDILSRKIRR